VGQLKKDDIMHKILIFLLSFLLMFINISFADPIINSVTGSLSHKASITINGSNFGAKSPAAPLIWDDCEDSTVNSDSAVTAKGWVDVWPRIGSAAYAPARTRYRNIPYRNTPAPHQYSEKYLAGAHYTYANNSPAYIGGSPDPQYRAVMVTADNGRAASNWYASFYYRLDPLWHSDGNYNNHKMTVVQQSGAAYTGTNQYNAYCSSHSPARQSGDTCRIEGHSSNNELGGCNTCPNTNNPSDAWVKFEEVIGTKRNLYIDRTNAFRDDPLSSIRSFTIGGYYRYVVNGGSISNTSDYRGGILDSNYRYFDDMYVDTSLARIMLCNNSNYTNATICEPQIPFAWSASSTSCKVNLGSLPSSGTGYLFVFDSSNNHNTTGYPVTIGGGGGGDTDPPEPPTGLRIE
jgi:hypothetical protein